VKWALLLALLASMHAGAAESCLVVYGQGRNLGEAPQNEAWDRINARFNGAVTERLRAAGLDAQPLLFKLGETDLAAAVGLLTERAAAAGCSRVVDTAVFADTDGALIVRLRVHPLLGGIGPTAAAAEPPRIGAPLYTAQSQFDFNRRTLERLNFPALAGEMVGGYLEQAGLVTPPAAAASPSQSRAAPPAAPASAAGSR